eukprot:Gb_08085 [translate_table: standard]
MVSACHNLVSDYAYIDQNNLIARKSTDQDDAQVEVEGNLAILLGMFRAMLALEWHYIHLVAANPDPSCQKVELDHTQVR